MDRMVSEVERWGKPPPLVEAPLRLGCEPDSPAPMDTLASSGLDSGGGAGGSTSGICGSDVDMASGAASGGRVGMSSASVAMMAGGGSTSGGRCEDGELLVDALLDAFGGSVSPEEDDDAASARPLITTHESSTTRCGLYGGIALPCCLLPRWLIANSTSSSFSKHAQSYINYGLKFLLNAVDVQQG
jgi:hypothetical protein